MRYYVNHGVEVRSENAALPISQKGRAFVEYLQQLPAVSLAADYGSGKGRYVDDLIARSEHLDIVDSLIQIERAQLFAGIRSSLRERFNQRNSINVLTIKEFQNSATSYDRISILNVLPVIPIPAIRARILYRCTEKLKSGGELIVAVNYRNSEYTKSINGPNAISFADGHLIDGLRGHFFICLLRPPIIDNALSELRLEILDKTRIEGTMIYRAKKS